MKAYDIPGPSPFLLMSQLRPDQIPKSRSDSHTPKCQMPPGWLTEGLVRPHGTEVNTGCLLRQSLMLVYIMVPGSSERKSTEKKRT